MSQAPNTAPLAAVSNIILYKNFHLSTPLSNLKRFTFNEKKKRNKLKGKLLLIKWLFNLFLVLNHAHVDNNLPYVTISWYEIAEPISEFQLVLRGFKD